MPVCNVDFRIGGVWHYCMKCKDENQGEFYGMESWGKAIYSKIRGQEKIVYTDYFSDSDGNIEETMPMLLTCYKKKNAVASRGKILRKKSIPPKRNAIILIKLIVHHHQYQQQIQL